MAADCEQTRARMLELLYGELAPAARAEVDAHVKGCPECRAELGALESTRAMARGALAADTPPPRVRAAILQAAAAAVPARKPVPAAASRPSFWGRLRGKWTLPTFATVGAVAVFLLASRIFMEPQKTYERGRQGLAPPPAEPAAPVAAAEAPAAAQTEPAPALKREAADERVRRPAASAAVPARRKPQPARPLPGGRLPVAQPAKESLDDLLEGSTSAPAKHAFVPPPPAARDKREQDERAFAPPPPPARNKRHEEDERAPREAALEDEDVAGTPSPGASGAGAPRAAAPRAAPAAAAGAKKAKASADAESPVARADRLFAQRRWAEAAVAYRDLLREDPRSPDASRWRQRLAACQAAAAPVAAPPPR